MSYNPKDPSAYDAIFQKAADTHGVSYDLLRKLAFNESSFNPNAKSPTGPKGIMQFTRGTARALGLNVMELDDVNDDRYKPELAIDAGARHLSDLVRKYNGDELKAALAYNQGEGANGAPQMAAYDKGDFASISEEGRNYMRKLADVAQSPFKGLLESFGGITPKAKGIPADDAFGGIEGQRKVGTELPQSTGFNVKGTEQEAAQPSFGKSFWDAHGTTLDEYEQRSTFFGFNEATEAEFKNSTLGVAFAAGRMDNGFDVFKDAITPTKWNSYTPTKEDLQKLRDSGLPPSYYHVVTGGDAETWDGLIDLAKRNYKYDQAAADSGMGAKLAAGVIGAGVDPLSYVPLVGVSGKGIKVVNKMFTVGAQSATLGVASEAMRTSVAGGDANYSEAALGGLIFGAGMTGIMDGVAAGIRKARGVEVANDFAAVSTRLEARESALNAGTADLTLLPQNRINVNQEHVGVPFADHPTEHGSAVLANGAILSPENPANPKTIKEFQELNVESAAPGIKLGGFTEIGLKTLSSPDDDVRRIATDLVRSPTGMQSGSSGKFGATASDIHLRLHSQDQRTYNQLYDAVRTAMKDPEFTMGDVKLSREGIRQEIYKRAALAIERPELQVDLTKGERQVMDIMKQHFDIKREMMENPAMFGNDSATSIFPGSRHNGTYVPNVYDRAAKQLMIQRYGAEGLQEGIAKSWLTSYKVRTEVKARVDEFLRENNAGVFEKANADAKLAADAENFLRGEAAPTMPDNLVTGGQQAGLQKVTGGNLDGDYFAGRRDYSGETPYMVDGDFVYYTAKTTDGAEFAVDVFTKDGKHAGSVEFAKREGDVWHNPSLEVNEKYRRQGIATKMYNIAETQSPDYVYRGKDKSVGGVRTPDGQAFRKKYDSKKAKKVEPQKFNTGGKVEPKVNEEAILKGLVAKYAQDKAYGISHTDEFSPSSVIDDNIEGLVGIENNKFLEARNLFDSDMAITMPDGEQFAVNDLRNFDMFSLMPAYDRRVNGDIAIMGGTGKTTADLKDEILALRKKTEGDGVRRGEVDALTDTVKILTGRARRNNDTVFETAIRGLNDLAFFAKNAYMAPQNLTEISGMLAKGNVSAVLHGVPVVRDWATKGKLSGSELKELHGMLFGKELDDLIRPGRQDIIQRMREASDTTATMSNIVGTFKYGTQELAARSPWTKLLNGSSNYLMDAARQGLMGEVATGALGGKVSAFTKDNFLKSASISKEQMNGINELFREYVATDVGGKLTIRDKQGFVNDPRAMDLWRLADKVADETMLRPHKVSNQDSKAFGAGIKMVMQFKNFVIKSLNGKFIRSYYEATKNNRAIDMALTSILSMGLASSYYVAQAHLKAQGMQEHQQKDYLKRALDPKMIAYAAITRSSHLGAPMSILSMAGGIAGFNDMNMLRSTILPKPEEKREKDKPLTGTEVAANIAGNIAKQIPALGYASGVLGAVHNAAGVLSAPNKPTQIDYNTGLMNSMREVLPNDVLTQQLIMKVFEEQGVRVKEPPKAN